MSDLVLRPHHALCLRFFVGEGYSEDFVRHMYEMIRTLSENPTVTLTDGCDAVCAACPKNRGGVCESDDKVRRIDSGVMRTLGLNVGERTPWRALYDRAYDEIIRTGRLSEICGGCEWLVLCGAVAESTTAGSGNNAALL